MQLQCKANLTEIEGFANQKNVIIKPVANTESCDLDLHLGARGSLLMSTFRDNLSDDELLKAANMMDWSLLHENAAMPYAYEAFKRKLPRDKLPGVVQNFFDEIALDNDKPQLNIFQYFRNLGGKQPSLTVFIETIAVISALINHIDACTSDSNGEAVSWSWCPPDESPANEYFVLLTPYGLFLNDDVVYEQIGMTIIGYCVTHGIAWYAHCCGDAKPGIDDVAADQRLHDR